MIDSQSVNYIFPIKLPILDVRTPAEFAKGHIPNAQNLPLFSDEDRHEVGLLYKEKGREVAMLEGLRRVGPVMDQLVLKARKQAPLRKVVLHCWRGGMRSRSVAWLLDQFDFDVILLEGGYKAFRNWALRSFEKKWPLVVLSGATGTGKTDILKTLLNRGQQVIDLEGMAHHKGSAFGALGESPEPTQEQFENDLALSLSQQDSQRVIWVEDESRRIGRRNIPGPFWEQMREAPVINLEVDRECRRDRLLMDYGDYQTTDLQKSIDSLKKRLGGLNYKRASEFLCQGNLKECCEILLNHYYDPAYQYGLENRPAEIMISLPSQSSDPLVNADLALEGLSELTENWAPHGN